MTGTTSRNGTTGSRRARTRRAALGLSLAGAIAALGVQPSAVAAAPAEPQRVRVVSANINFALDATTVGQRFDNYSRFADIVLFQEAKEVNLKTEAGIDRTEWIVLQETGREPRGSDRWGSAIAIRSDILRAPVGMSDFRLTLGTTNDGGGAGCSLQTRWIAHVPLTLKNGAELRPASLHLPPPVCQSGTDGPYERMIASAVQLSNAHPNRLLLGGDFNKVVRSDPNNLGARADGRIVPRALPDDIDGFYKPKDLPQDGDVREVGFASKGHDAVQLVVNVPSTF